MNTLTISRLKKANRVMTLSALITMTTIANAQTHSRFFKGKQKNKVNDGKENEFKGINSGLCAAKFGDRRNATEGKAIGPIEFHMTRKEARGEFEAFQRCSKSSIIGLGFPQPHTSADDFPMSLMVDKKCSEIIAVEAGMSMDSYGKTLMCSDVSAKNKIGMFNFTLQAEHTLAQKEQCDFYLGSRFGLSYYTHVTEEFTPFQSYTDGEVNKLWPSAQFLLGAKIHSTTQSTTSIELSAWSRNTVALGVICRL